MTQHQALGVLGPWRLTCIAILLLSINPTIGQLPACSSSVLETGHLLYGFPECNSSDTKREDFAKLFYTPNVTGSPADVLITVRALYGTVSIAITEPSQTSTKNGKVSVGKVSVGDGPATYRFVNVPTPGNFTIELDGQGSYSKWQVTAFSQKTNITHDSHERALFRSWVDACCNLENPNDVCSLLSSWGRDAVQGETQGETQFDTANDDGACGTAQNMCDSEGRLTRLAITTSASSNVFPKCNYPPTALAGFTSLRVLNLNKLYMNWTLDQVSMLVAKLPYLEELLLDNNVNLHGGFYMAACAMFRKEQSLRSFSAVYTNVSGQLPPCVFSSPKLEELNLFDTAVSGQLPDFTLSGSPLFYLNVSANGWDDTDRKLTGTLPPSIGSANKLAVLALKNNELNGTLPDLPESLEILLLQDNKLSGSIPTSLYSLQQLRCLHLEGNMLAGTVSPGIGSMKSLENVWLTGNKQLSGSIDFPWTNPRLLSVEISNTGISGAIPASLATLKTLRTISITGNKGITDQQRFADALLPDNSIVWYNVSFNCIKSAPEGLKHLAAFTKKRFPEVSDDQGWPSGIFDISNNGMAPASFPYWLLGALPNQSLVAQLEQRCQSFIFRVADIAQIDSNRLPCPTGGSNAPEERNVAPSISEAIYCQTAAGKMVTLKTALDQLPLLAPAAVPAPAVSLPNSTLNDPTIANQGSDTQTPSSTTTGNNKSDDLALILGVTCTALVATAALFFVLFKYALQLRRKSFVEFKDSTEGKGQLLQSNPFQTVAPVGNEVQGVRGGAEESRGQVQDAAQEARSTELAWRDVESGTGV